MKPGLKLGAAAAAVVTAAAGAVQEAVVAAAAEIETGAETAETIIKGMHASPANLAGK
jgi:hypothetical protein